MCKLLRKVRVGTECKGMIPLQEYQQQRWFFIARERYPKPVLEAADQGSEQKTLGLLREY